MRKPDRLVVLDSIRGLAAFIVVIHHCLLTQPAFCKYFFSNWRNKYDCTFFVYGAYWRSIPR